MRFFLIILSVLTFNSITAQGGRPQRGQGGMQNGEERQRPQTPTFDASKMAGIFTYDDVDVVKKLKIKKNDPNFLQVRKAIIGYNNKIEEITLLNRDNFDTLNVYMNAIIRSSRLDRMNNRMQGERQMGMNDDDDSPIKKARDLSREKIEPAKTDVRNAERNLNDHFEVLLKEKLFEKWLKYQKNKKDELKPKGNSNQNNSTRMPNGGSRSQGRFSGGGSMR